MLKQVETKVFNNANVIPHGWYWALPSHELKQGQIRELKLFREKWVLFRGESGQVHAIEAYCPHMGAHLKEGKVEGDEIRCGFHGWKFSGGGVCSDTPCLREISKQFPIPTQRNLQVAERFGMIWVHSESQSDSKPQSQDPLPEFPALAGKKLLVRIDQASIRNCHPTLILGGGVDEDHFRFVHQSTTRSTGNLQFEFERHSSSVIRYWNSAEIPRNTLAGRIMHFVYAGRLKYQVTYWYASTALAELGPPLLPLYSIFAYRPTEEGRTEGLNIYVTPFRRGVFGKWVSAFALWATRRILRKGGGEDAIIQNSIRLKLSPHALSNKSFAAFVRYVEEQPCFSTLASTLKEME